MNLNSKKPEKRPLYVYYIIAVVIIILLNCFCSSCHFREKCEANGLHYLSESCRQRKSI